MATNILTVSPPIVKSRPLQNRQLVVVYYYLKYEVDYYYLRYLVDGFVKELTFQNELMNKLCQTALVDNLIDGHKHLDRVSPHPIAQRGSQPHQHLLLRSCSNRPFQVLDWHWRSPGFGDLLHTSRQPEKTI